MHLADTNRVLARATGQVLDTAALGDLAVAVRSKGAQYLTNVALTNRA